jgi:hypothetical protein
MSISTTTSINVTTVTGTVNTEFQTVLVNSNSNPPNTLNIAAGTANYQMPVPPSAKGAVMVPSAPGNIGIAAAVIDGDIGINVEQPFAAIPFQPGQVPVIYINTIAVASPVSVQFMWE